MLWRLTDLRRLMTLRSAVRSGSFKFLDAFLVPGNLMFKLFFFLKAPSTTYTKCL